MKKTIIILSAAALVFASCQKEQPSSAIVNGLQLTATVEQQDGGSASKTYLDNLAVKWSAGDQVNVFTDADTPEKLTLTLAIGDSTTVGTFTTSETPTGTPQYAIYPASDDNSILNEMITFTLPATQDYVANSFDNGANVAVGQVSNGSVNYKNVCGVFKLSIKGGYTVSRIELTGRASEKLNGTFSVDATAATPYISTVTTTDEDEKKLTLNCGTNGVQLDVATATDFYFVVPVGSFAKGFNAVVYDMVGGAYYATLSSEESNTINRSKVRAMPAAAATRLPAAYQELDYTEHTGLGDGVTNTGFSTGVEPSDIFGAYICLSVNSGTQLKDCGLCACSTSGGYTGVEVYYYKAAFMWNSKDISSSLDMGYGDVMYYKLNYKNDRKLIINNELVQDNIEKNGGDYTGRPFYLFATYNSKGLCGKNIKIFFAIITDNTSVIKYYIPARRVSDSQLGLYDLAADPQNAFNELTLGTYVAGTALE